MTDIRLVDPPDDAALAAWYDVTRAGAVAGRTAALVFAYEEVRQSLRNPSTVTQRETYAAYEDSTLVGALKLDFPLKENLRLVEWTLNVAPDHRGKGCGSALFQFGLELAAERGRSIHVAEVDVPTGRRLEDHPGSRFALRHGFSSQHCEDRLLLTLPLPSGDLERLRDRAAPRHVGYDMVSWTGDCPQEHLDDFARMRTVMEREVPTGDLDREPIVWDADRIRHGEQRLRQQGFMSITTAATHQEHGFCAYSLMFVPEHTPGEVYQDDTLVVSDHRGRNLGTALKARNLDVLAQQFPDRRRVHTWTAGGNAAMRKVNADFGFVTVEQLHEFQRVDQGRGGSIAG